MKINVEKWFHISVIVFAMITGMIVARGILIPVAFALLFAFMLYPLCRRFEKWGFGRMISTFFSLLTVLILLSGISFLFTNQILDLSGELPAFKEKLVNIFTETTVLLNEYLHLIPGVEKEEIFTQAKNWFSSSAGSIVGKTFTNTASFLTGLFTTILFTLLFLFYRRGLAHGFQYFFPPDQREGAIDMLRSLQKVGQEYLLGVTIVAIILGSLNSIGLMIIGIDSPFLFGFLAGALAIIPFVGTILGAIMPVLYAFVTYDSLWVPISVGLLFWFVQILEGNLISPKIVGGNLHINPLAAILSIFVGASIWGLAGMILFLPFTAMFKSACDFYPQLKPIGLLLGPLSKDKNQQGGGKYFEKVRAFFLKIFQRS